MRKSSTRTSHYPFTGSRHAELLVTFQQQMADFARGELLRELRKGLHLSQEDAAHEIGVSTKALRTWEKGGRIKWPNAKAAGAFYEVDPESLISRETVTVPATSNGGSSDPFRSAEPSQLDRLEVEVAAIRVDIGTLSAQLAEMQRLLARMTKTASSQNRNRKAN